MKKILLQTTIGYEKDDWSIERFSMLANVLAAIEDGSGSRLFNVVARDRENHVLLFSFHCFWHFCRFGRQCYSP